MDLSLLLNVALAIFGAGVGWGASQAANKGARHVAQEARRAADEADRAAHAAHKRIDVHGERLARVEAMSEGHARALEKSVARIEESLAALHERLDRLVDRRTA